VPDSTQYLWETEFHDRGGIRNRKTIKLVTADPLLRPRGHWYRSYFFHKTQKLECAEQILTVCQGIISCHLWFSWRYFDSVYFS
jgi:hypothetical protein